MAHSKNRMSHKKEAYYIFCIFAVLAILLLSFFGPGGYRELREARLELQEQRIRVDQLERENSRRMKTIEDLTFKKSAQEKYAREKGYAKPGEIIQQLPRSPETAK